MKRIALLALASGLAIAAATPANAAITLAYSIDGGANQIVLATDAGTPGSVGFVGTQNGYFFNSGATGSPITAQFDLLTQSINIQQAGARSNSLIVYVTETGLPTINNGTLMSAFTSNTLLNATATISSYYSPTNQLYTGTLLQTRTFNSLDRFSGMNTISAAGPFSLTTRYDITFTGANGNFNGTANITAVPEPATWGMMIMGFGLLGGVMRRRSTKVAFA